MTINANLLRRTFSDRRISLPIYAAGVAAYSIMILAIWPSMSSNLETLEQLWANYPEAIRSMFGGNISIATFDGFLTLEYFSLIWVIIVFAFSISVATASVAGEIEKGTMELLLSQPISRRSIIMTRMSFHLIGLLIIIAATMAPIVAIAPLIDAEIDRTGLLALSFSSLLFYLALGSLAFLLSSVLSDRGRAVFICVGILIASYAIDILSAFNDTIERVNFLSLFNYYDPYRYLHDVSFAWGDLTVLAILGIVCTAGAILWFDRRDIAV
ncbi:MAG: ABC transporter permease subunit [Thermoleophilia bacterium]